MCNVGLGITLKDLKNKKKKLKDIQKYIIDDRATTIWGLYYEVFF